MVLDYDFILNDLNNVIKLSPNFEFAYYNKALVQCSRKLYNEALESLNKAIEINPDFAEAYFNRGIIHIYNGNETEGTADLSKAGELGIFKAYNVIKRYTSKNVDETKE
jgi:tetratricopeptide (TPR) repeat protein